MSIKLLQKKSHRAEQKKSKEKCFICGNPNHSSNFCMMKNPEVPFCERCKNNGHFTENCLTHPGEVTKKMIKESGMKCFVCGSDEHLVCHKNDDTLLEEYYSDEVEVSEDEKEVKKSENSKKSKKVKKRVFLSVPNEKIAKMIFCYHCGGNHSSQACLVKFSKASKKQNKQSKANEKSHTFNYQNILKSLQKRNEMKKLYTKILKRSTKENIYNRII